MMFFDKKKKNMLLPKDRILNEKTPFPVKEAFNTLRTNLVFALAPTGGKTVIVASANASECKSTTAANLAIALAQNGSKVLLIDADLRKPTLHTFFRVNYTHGLSRFLVGFESFSEALCRDVIPNLDFMSSGVIPPNPSELLGSERMKIFLEKMNEYYDYIIIDTPPVNLVTDATVLSAYASGVLFVLRYGHTTYDDLRRAQASFASTGIHILGFTLAEVPNGRGRYYSKHYKKYSKYGQYASYGQIRSSGKKMEFMPAKNVQDTFGVSFDPPAKDLPDDADATEVNAENDQD